MCVNFVLKIKDLDVVIYLEDIQDIARCYSDICKLASYSSVGQVLLLLNSNDKNKVSFVEHHKIQIVLTKEKLSQGAALNKSLPHLHADNLLLLDHRALPNLNLRPLFDQEFPFLANSFINISLKSHKHSVYSSLQTASLWASYNLNLVSFLMWGAVVIDKELLFSLYMLQSANLG